MENAQVLKFDEIVGQERALRLLERAQTTGRLPHAYLFVGPEGVGKETTARARFFRLVCREQAACGQCPGCRKFIKGIHPDVETLAPQGKSIKIEQVRALEGKLRFVPLEAPRRLILIPEAEALTREAANALLKSLEEPPSYTLFVLLAGSPDALLPTIVSRCQIIRFRPLTTEEISRLLVERFGKLPEEAEGLAVLSQGSIGRALRLAERGFLEELSRIAGALVSEDPARVLTLDEVLANHKDQLPVLLERVRVWLRQSRRDTLGLEPYPRGFPQKAPVPMVVPAMEAVERTVRALEYNVSRELALLSLFLTLKKLWRRAQDAEVAAESTGAA